MSINKVDQAMLTDVDKGRGGHFCPIYVDMNGAHVVYPLSNLVEFNKCLSKECHYISTVII